MNIFFSRNEKKIPNKLSECTQTDSTVSNLQAWAERLEMLGRLLFGILICIGVLTTYSTATVAAQIDEELIMPTVAIGVATWGIYAFIEYCVYNALVLLINALASITQNSSITANVALYEASKAEPGPAVSPATAVNPNIRANNSSVPDGMWICRNCGTYNKDVYGHCKGCGEYRSR